MSLKSPRYTGPIQSGCHVNTNSVWQSVPTASITVLEMDNPTYDYGNEYDEVTNYRFTSTHGGIYHVDMEATFNAVGNNVMTGVYLYQDGSGALYKQVGPGLTGENTTLRMSGVIKLAATHYVDLRVQQKAGVNKNILGEMTIYKIWDYYAP